MYQALPDSILEKMRDEGRVDVKIKKGWETAGPSSWQSIPHDISYGYGDYQEKVFTCYISVDGNTAQITNIEPTEIIKDKRKLVDAYMYVVIYGLIGYCKVIGKKRLIIDSWEPSVIDHMVDHGFYISPKGIDNGGGRGFLALEE